MTAHMTRGLLVLFLLAACSASPTWTLWKVEETVASPGAVAERVATPLEGNLDRTACELVLAMMERALHDRFKLVGRPMARAADGAYYVRYSEQYACLVKGQRP